MRILIIGGTRFIGPFVVRELVELGYDVIVAHRGETEPDLPASVRHIHIDRAHIADAEDAIAAARADVVLDMCAMRERDAATLLDAIAGVAPRLVVVSSLDVYRAYGRMHGSEPGPIEPMPLAEDSPLRDRLYPYRGERANADLDEYDKLPVERLVLSDDRVQGSVIRLPAVHGEGDYQHRLFMEVRRFEAGRPYLLMAEESRSWRWPRAYVANAAHAIALVVTSEETGGRVYHVAEIDAPTQEDHVRTCAEIAGWRGEIVFAPNAELPEHLRANVNFAQDMVVHSSRIRDALGYAEIVPPREGLARAIAWEREHPPRKLPQHLLDFEAEDECIARLRSEDR